MNQIHLRAKMEYAENTLGLIEERKLAKYRLVTIKFVLPYLLHKTNLYENSLQPRREYFQRG